jgi:hypothetical protein
MIVSSAYWVIIIDVHGNVILSAWRSLQHIALAEEAEMEACLQGYDLLLSGFVNRSALKLTVLH